MLGVLGGHCRRSEKESGLNNMESTVDGNVDTYIVRG